MKSREVIKEIIKEKKSASFSQRQLKNHYDYLKRKYVIWMNIIGYDRVTDTVQSSAEQRGGYLKVLLSMLMSCMYLSYLLLTILNPYRGILMRSNFGLRVCNTR